MNQHPAKGGEHLPAGTPGRLLVALNPATNALGVRVAGCGVASEPGDDVDTPTRLVTGVEVEHAAPRQLPHSAGFPPELLRNIHGDERAVHDDQQVGDGISGGFATAATRNRQEVPLGVDADERGSAAAGQRQGELGQEGTNRRILPVGFQIAAVALTDDQASLPTGALVPPQFQHRRPTILPCSVRDNNASADAAMPTRPL